MRGKSRSPEESAQIPQWIVTFSDMTTNLLTFFVLLLSLGQVRDDSLFDEGNRISRYFLQSVKAGFGFRDAALFEHGSIKYGIDNPELSKGVTRDAREQRTQRLFDTLRRSMQTRPSGLTSEGMSFSIANVRFAPGETTLDPASKQWLSRFCANLQQTLDPASTLLYVIGVAGPETTEVQTWRLAARQSRAVTDFLRQTLSAPTVSQVTAGPRAGDCPWRIFSWGAGPGSDWAGQDRLPPGQSQILIAVLRRNN